MKKSILFGMSLLFASAAFVGCTSSPDFEEAAQESAQYTYEKAFIKKFGQPDPNHQWGFDVYGVSQVTRAKEKDKEDKNKWNFSCRLMGEDLTIDENSDFDFNDIVVDVVVEGKKNTTLILQAAGGTYPLYIKKGNDVYEIHEQFGVATDQMVNTGAGSVEKDPVYIQTGWNIPNEESVHEIQLYVVKNGQKLVLEAKQGVPAAKICVPITVDWCNERQSIEKKYKAFKDWVQKEDYIWF